MINPAGRRGRTRRRRAFRLTWIRSIGLNTRAEPAHYDIPTLSRSVSLCARVYGERPERLYVRVSDPGSRLSARHARHTLAEERRDAFLSAFAGAPRASPIAPSTRADRAHPRRTPTDNWSTSDAVPRIQLGIGSSRGGHLRRIINRGKKKKEGA